jgi:hypothetical protein
LITPEQELRIEQLLRAGRPPKEVAEAVGCGHGTVEAIRSGRRSPRKSRRAEYRRRKDQEAVEELREVEWRYCDACGATVTWPCVACAARRQGAGVRSQGAGNGKPGRPILGLELRGQARERYEALHRRRIATVLGEDNEQ